MPPISHEMVNQWDLLPVPVIFTALDLSQVLFCNQLAKADLADVEQLEHLFESHTDWRGLHLRLRHGQLVQYEARVLNAHHKPIWVLIAGRPAPKNEGWILVLQDVNERRRRDLNLQTHEVLHQQILNSSNEAYLQFDLQSNRIVDCNPAFLQLLGFTRQQVVGNTLADFVGAGHQGHLLTQRRWYTRQAMVKDELQLIRANGEACYVQIDANVVINSQQQVVTAFALITDISQRKATEDRMLYLAFYDTLTALPNRLLFEERLNQALLQTKRNKIPCALMFLDLDNFKDVNDTVGHDGGDALLKELARRLSGLVRETDTVARLSGDEFVVLCQGTGELEPLERLAAKLLDAIAQPFEWMGRTFYPAASLGIARAPNDAQNAVGLRKCADTAMYCAKRTGKNRYAFFEMER